MNVIHSLCPWSKHCSSRSLGSTAILKLVFTVEIMLWTASRPISLRHFPILLLKTSSLLSPSLQCQLPAWGHPKNPRLDEVTGQQEGLSRRWRGSIWVFLHFFCPHSLFCLCSTSGLNSGGKILLFVPAASLTILVTMDLSALIFAASFIEVTPFLSRMVLKSWFLFSFSIFTARRPLSVFLFAVFLSLFIRTRSNGGPRQSRLCKSLRI